MILKLKSNSLLLFCQWRVQVRFQVSTQLNSKLPGYKAQKHTCVEEGATFDLFRCMKE